MVGEFIVVMPYSDCEDFTNVLLTEVLAQELHEYA
jgi:hypothetical protein